MINVSQKSSTFNENCRKGVGYGGITWSLLVVWLLSQEELLSYLEMFPMPILKIGKDTSI